jgi:hypothetical protein
MSNPSILQSLLEQAEQDPLLEMFLLTAIDRYTESLVHLDEEALREQVLEGSPRQSQSGINAAAWKERARKVREVLKDGYDKA